MTALAPEPIEEAALDDSGGLLREFSGIALMAMAAVVMASGLVVALFLRGRLMRRIGLAFARFLLISCLALWRLHSIGLAQDRGQICLSAYADEDGDGRRAPTELPLTRGVAASLLNADELTLASQLLADSPYAADGMLCFDQLLAGDYQLIISSSAFSPTSPARAEARVQPGAPPAHIVFGAKPLTAAQSAIPRLDAAATSGLAIVFAGLATGVALVSLLGCMLFGWLAAPPSTRQAWHSRRLARRGAGVEP